MKKNKIINRTLLCPKYTGLGHFSLNCGIHDRMCLHRLLIYNQTFPPHLFDSRTSPFCRLSLSLCEGGGGSCIICSLFHFKQSTMDYRKKKNLILILPDGFIRVVQDIIIDWVGSSFVLPAALKLSSRYILTRECLNQTSEK
jgi:hypothetical protein